MLYKDRFKSVYLVQLLLEILVGGRCDFGYQTEYFVNCDVEDRWCVLQGICGSREEGSL